jgi:YgiT-type zinc finger domain-containing protein
MGSRFENEEDTEMKCRVCGSRLQPMTTDLPFKITERTIVILKHLPVTQCERCREYSIEDSIFARVEELLSKADTSAELEIIPFAA